MNQFLAKRTYQAQVWRQLAHVPHLRRQVLRDLRPAQEDYLLDRPNAGYSALCEQFGDPKQFACELLANLDAEQLAQELARAKRARILRRGLLSAAIAVLLVLLAYYICIKEMTVVHENTTVVDYSDLYQGNLVQMPTARPGIS